MPREYTKIAIAARRKARTATNLTNANVENKVANVYAERATTAHAKLVEKRKQQLGAALRTRTSKQRDR